METSVKAAEVISSSCQAGPEQSADSQAASSPTPQAAAQAHFPSRASGDHLEDMSRKLEDILSTYGSAASLMEKTVVVKADEDKMEVEDDVTIAKEAGNVMQSLNRLSSPDEKLEVLVKKYAELAEARRADDKRQRALQQKHAALLREKENLQAENSRSILARSKMEGLCRELQKQNKSLKEETLQRCREDEERRSEISTHFQSTLTEIQAQIEHHSNRNAKLCSENAMLADKLESLMQQYESREESLEKLNKHRDLQLKLSDTRLEQSNALLAEAEEKHKREKEYLLKEAIDKTKKCYAMKEQELAMKKKLTLYSQKFDEFQITLAKSNDIYVSFKQEMDKMTGKMKKLEKESNVWKTRFESCNQALAGMIEERAEKDKEYESFVLKIQKLELLCRALQEERKALYDKIKDVRSSNTQSGLSFKANMGLSEEGELIIPEVTVPEVTVPAEVAPNSAAGLLTSVEIQEIQEQDPVLTQGMSRLKEEQARLQEFAASLLSRSSDAEEDDDECDDEEDEMASAFAGLTKQSRVQKKTVEEKEESAVPEAIDPKPAVAATVAEPTSIPTLKTQKTAETTKPPMAVAKHEERPTEAVVVTVPVKETTGLTAASTGSRAEAEGAKRQPTLTVPVPEEKNTQLSPEALSGPTKVESKPAEEKVATEVMEIELSPTPAALTIPVQEEKTQKEQCAEPVQEPVQGEASEPVQPEPEAAHAPSRGANFTTTTATTTEADRACNNPQQPIRKKKKRNNKKV